MNAMQTDEMADHILGQVVPESTVTAEDQATFERHRDLLLGLEDDLVAIFYDTLYQHPPTAAVFEEGERPAREQTLREWWQRTIGKPLDGSYWRWMTLVGIVHIRRGVRNPMMSSIVNVVSNVVHDKAAESLDAEETEALRVAFSHLATTITSLISEAYTLSYIGALENLAGLDPRLTKRMLDIEVRQLEEDARAAI